MNLPYPWRMNQYADSSIYKEGVCKTNRIPPPFHISVFIKPISISQHIKLCGYNGSVDF